MQNQILTKIQIWLKWLKNSSFTPGTKIQLSVRVLGSLLFFKTFYCIYILVSYFGFLDYSQNELWISRVLRRYIQNAFCTTRVVLYMCKITKLLYKIKNNRSNSKKLISPYSLLKNSKNWKKGGLIFRIENIGEKKPSTHRSSTKRSSTVRERDREREKLRILNCKILNS